MFPLNKSLKFKKITNRKYNNHNNTSLNKTKTFNPKLMDY